MISKRSGKPVKAPLRRSTFLFPGASFSESCASEVKGPRRGNARTAADSVHGAASRIAVSHDECGYYDIATD